MATKKAKATKTKEVKVEAPKVDNFERRIEIRRRLRKLIKIVIGCLISVGGIWLILRFWQNFITVFKEWVGIVVVVVGLFIVLLGLLD